MPSAPLEGGIRPVQTRARTSAARLEGGIRPPQSHSSRDSVALRFASIMTARHQRCEALHKGNVEAVTIVGWLLDDDGEDDDVAVVRADRTGKVLHVLMSGLMDVASDA